MYLYIMDYYRDDLEKRMVNKSNLIYLFPNTLPFLISLPIKTTSPLLHDGDVFADM